MAIGAAWQETYLDLTRRRAMLVAQVEDIDKTLDGLMRLYKIDTQVATLAPLIQRPAFHDGLEGKTPAGGRFSSISVRWAVLWLLHDDLTEGGSTAEIAQRLIEDGVTSKSANFNSNVSAVLSAMRDRGEVRQDASRWILTEDGRQAWSHIRLSRVFNNPQQHNQAIPI